VGITHSPLKHQQQFTRDYSRFQVSEIQIPYPHFAKERVGDLKMYVFNPQMSRHYQNQEKISFFSLVSLVSLVPLVFLISSPPSM